MTHPPQRLALLRRVISGIREPWHLSPGGWNDGQQKSTARVLGGSRET